MNRSDGISITYAPDRVEVGRVFRIALDVPEGQTPVDLAAPESVQILDRTAPERAGENLFYCRARRLERGAEFRFDGRSGGAEVAVDCLDRAGILERREQGAIRLPRRWPVWEDLDELKTSRTIWRRDDLARALVWSRRHREGVRQLRESAEGWVAKADDFLWDLLPQTQFSRYHFVNLKVGCPIHGDAIFKHGGYYPWSMDVEGMPYKVQCPVGGEWYPSNDLAADDFTSGAYPDDGHGCVQGAVKWNFVPIYQNVRGYHFTGGIHTLADAYVRTGDEAMLHKLRVMLLRIADEWGYLSGKVEDRFGFGETDSLDKGRWHRTAAKVADLNGSGMVNYSINLAFDFVTYATAYDLAWEGLDEDRDLLRLARERLGLESGEQVRRYIEEHLLRVGAQTALDGGAHSNLPHPQLGLTYLTLCMNYRAGARLADWLWNGGGQMRYWLSNFFFRDGAAYESTGGYNAHHVDDTPTIVRGLDRLQKLRPEAYQGVGIESFAADPKMKALYTHLAEMVCIGRMYPQVGDGGCGPSPENPPLAKMYSTSEKPVAYEYAFETYGDPVFAQVLWAGKGYEPGIESRLSREAVAAVIQRVGPDIELESQIFDGYGIAVLRSGSGDRARALWLRYGQARAHRHDDMLDIGLLAHRRTLMSHLGYPYSWASHGVWDGNWLTHYRVAVQGIGEQPIETAEGPAKGEGVYAGGAYYKTGKESLEDGTLYSGALRSFVTTPGFQAAHADGEAFRDLRFPPHKTALDQRQEKGWVQHRYQVFRDRVYSRWVGLIDVDDQDFYVLDIHRVRGGSEHWWSFHGPHGEAIVDGLHSVEAWPDGSPAGKEIGYGAVEKLETDDTSLHSLTYLYDCRRGEVTRPWKATWGLSGDSNLELRMRQLADDGEVIVGRGKPPISSMEDPPYQLTWTLAHRRGPAPLSSQFVTLIEASEAGHPVVRRVERVPASGSGAFEPVVVRAETAKGTDLVVSTWQGGVVTPESGDWSFDGEYGFARTGETGVEQVSLTGGQHFVVEGTGVVATTGTVAAEVLGGDFGARQVVLSGAPQPFEALVGHYVRFDSDDRSSTYRVLASEPVPQGVCLSLDVDLRIGEGTADGFEKGAIISHTHFPLAGFRYFHGAYLQAAGGEVFVVDHIESEVVAQTESGFQPKSWIVLQSVEGREVPAERLRSACGEGGSFIIYDVGAGDRATFTPTSYMRRVDDSTWEGYVGPETILAVGRGLSGTAQVSRGSQQWSLPILDSEADFSSVDLGAAGIGMGPVEIVLK